MDAAARHALARLRAADGEALGELARLVVEEAAATPLDTIAHPRWIAGQVATALEAVARHETMRDAVARRLEETLAAWRTEARSLGHWLPAEAEEPLREALARPWVPSEDLLSRLLDQRVLRDLMREVLDGTLRRFRRRLVALDQGILGGLGGRAAKRGRGLFGGMAESVVGAMKGEFEQRVDALIQEFLSGATREAMAAVARHMADPGHAEAYGELRVSVLDVLQETEVRELARELEKLDPLEYVDIALAAIRAQLDDEGFVDRTEARVRDLLAEVGDGTLGAWLEEVGLRDVWTSSTADLLSQQLERVVRTDGFETWWMRLFK